MFLSREIYRSELAQDAILASINSKGRKIKGLDREIQNACNTLSPEAGQELFRLCKRIHLSFNYRKVALKALHNPRNNDEDSRKTRVWDFMDRNPSHPAINDTTMKKFNYWTR